MSAEPKTWRRIGRRFAVGTVLVLTGTLAVTYLVVDQPRPRGRVGPAAEALAARLEAAVDVEAWNETGAVRFVFAGRHHHLWDRRRDFARVRWGDVEALLHAGRPSGRAYRNGRELHGSEARSVLQDAHAHWINDTFWLNPLAKLRDPGVELSLVDLEDGREALLVTYASGGLTPGDAYLWLPGAEDRPSAWRLWVSIIPLGGLEVGWTGWSRLSTGAWVSTRHPTALGWTLELSEVRGAADLRSLVPGSDPFAPLLDVE